MNLGNTIQIPNPKQHYAAYSNNPHHQAVSMNISHPNPNSQTHHNNPNNVQNHGQNQIAHNMPNNNMQQHIDQQHQLQQQQQSGQGQMLNNVNMNNNNNFRNQSNVGLQQQHHSMGYHQNQQHQNQSQHGFPGNDQQQIQQHMSQSQQQTQSSSSTLELHPNIVLGGLLDIDLDDRPHVCQICQATYKTRTHLRRHMFIHLQNRPYPCGDCSKGFNRKEHLNKHIEAVHSGTRYKCHMCGKEISRKDHLARHIKNMHNSDLSLNDSMLQAQIDSTPVSTTTTTTTSPPKKLQPRLSIPTPRSTQDNNDGMHFMMGDSISISTKPTPQRVPKPGNLSQPMSIIDQLKFANDLLGDGNKKMLLQLYNCQECHATFTLEKDLNTHSRVHKPQPYKCSQCTRAYTRREKLTEHIRCFHQGQKFTCEYCDKQLSRKDHVLRHIRSVHPEVLAHRFVAIADSGALDSTGNTSGAGGNSRLSGNNSSANHALQGSSGNNIPSMGDMGILLRSVCHVCLKVFGTSYHLARHVESCHNGDVRPFACTFCKKQFKRKDHLTKHCKSHCPTMKDATNPRISSGNTRKPPKSAAAKLESQLLTINRETINSLQIEMTTPDEDVEVAIAIVNKSNRENDRGNKILKNQPISDSGMIITPTTIDSSKLQVGNTFDNLNEVINNSTNRIMIGRKSTNNLYSTINSKNNNENNSTNNRLLNEFNCGHCQQKFSTKDKMIQHLQQHPSSSSSGLSNTSISTSTNTNSHISTSSSVTDVIEMINNSSKDTSESHLWT